jgi:hypothetical protein
VPALRKIILITISSLVIAAGSCKKNNIQSTVEFDFNGQHYSFNAKGRFINDDTAQVPWKDAYIKSTNDSPAGIGIFFFDYTKQADSNHIASGNYIDGINNPNKNFILVYTDPVKGGFEDYTPPVNTINITSTSGANRVMNGTFNCSVRPKMPINPGSDTTMEITNGKINNVPY